MFSNMTVHECMHVLKFDFIYLSWLGNMGCDVGEATESLENELCYDYNYELRSFSNPSVASPTSQLILQPFCRFSYVTGFSLTSPGEPPMLGRWVPPKEMFWLRH